MHAAADEREAAARDLDGVSLAAILDAPAAADRHFQLAGQRWTAPRGNPDTEFPSLNAKLRDADRSEEHKSELPSLMRLSYAACCLKKKKSIQTKSST